MRTPRPGLWKAVVDPVRLTPGATLRYTDIITHSRYGSARSLTSNAERRLSETWSDSVVVTRGVAVPAGSELVLVADVVDQALEQEEQARPLAVFAGTPYRPTPLATVVSPLGKAK